MINDALTSHSSSICLSKLEIISLFFFCRLFERTISHHMTTNSSIVFCRFFEPTISPHMTAILTFITCLQIFCHCHNSLKLIINESLPFLSLDVPTMDSILTSIPLIALAIIGVECFLFTLQQDPYKYTTNYSCHYWCRVLSLHPSTRFPPSVWIYFLDHQVDFQTQQNCDIRVLNHNDYSFHHYLTNRCFRL